MPKPVKTMKTGGGVGGCTPLDHGRRVGKGDYALSPATPPCPPPTPHPPVYPHGTGRGVRTSSPGFFRLVAKRDVAELITDPVFWRRQNRRFSENIHAGIWTIAIEASSHKTTVFHCILLFSAVFSYTSDSFWYSGTPWGL